MTHSETRADSSSLRISAGTTGYNAGLGGPDGVKRARFHSTVRGPHGLARGRRPVAAADESRYQRLMQAHHYLGALPKIGETQWYVARWRREWVALIGFSAPALKCRARDAWIGWDFRVQYDRLHLVTDNSRFLILPGWHRPNLASRLLSLCERRLVSDWPRRFGHPLLLLETFVDPSRFRGTIYRASNWLCLGHTRGYRRVHGGYSATPTTPKLVFARPLSPNARARLTNAALDPIDRHGGPRIMLAADTMRALPLFFADIDDPRRRQGRRHPLPTVLAIATAATLCGMRGYKAMAEWADDLTQRARERFRCRRYDGHLRRAHRALQHALLTQTKLADFLIGRGAHYLFAVKGNRPNLLTDLEFHFRKRGEPDFQERAQLRHGRIESRAIWTTATLNDYLTFPHVGQAFLVERTVTAKSTGKQTVERLRHHQPFPQHRQRRAPARAEPRADRHSTDCPCCDRGMSARTGRRSRDPVTDR